LSQIRDLAKENNMSKFCKVFEDDVVGQILVKLDSSEDDKPEVRFYAKPPELGVCSLAMVFEDTGLGWKKAEVVFEDMTESTAAKIIIDSPMFSNQG
jgi:hypothetical protein